MSADARLMSAEDWLMSICRLLCQDDAPKKGKGKAGAKEGKAASKEGKAGGKETKAKVDKKAAGMQSMMSFFGKK